MVKVSRPRRPERFVAREINGPHGPGRAPAAQVNRRRAEQGMLVMGKRRVDHQAHAQQGLAPESGLPQGRLAGRLRHQPGNQLGEGQGHWGRHRRPNLEQNNRFIKIVAQ